VSLRRLALLPFEVSRAAPEGVQLEGSEPDEEGAPVEKSAPDAERAPLDAADRKALALWLHSELGNQLARSGALAPLRVELEGDAAVDAELLVEDGAPLSSEPIAAAAAELQAELGLACALRADAQAVELTGLLADAAGEERLRFTFGSEMGAAHALPRRLARELLLALGEDAAAPEAGDEEPVAPEAVLLLCRGARALAQSQSVQTEPALRDPSPGFDELLEALSLAPSLSAARELLLRGAAEAAQGPWMPASLAALEHLAELLPGDARALVALADYRQLHHDPAGARELLLRARDLIEGGDEEAGLLARLAALAEQAGRFDEAEQHLRAATRLADDPSLHLHLGLLLGPRDAREALRSLQRAVVLAPEHAAARLALARQLRAHGEAGRAATEAARAAQLARSEPEIAQAAAALLRELITESR